MIKYDGYYITFQEVPNEVSLTFTITNCQHCCNGCHSPWLQQDIGKSLIDNIAKIIDKYSEMITCVCFMGEGNDYYGLSDLSKKITYKTALYTGLNKLEDWMYSFDYIKVGEYNHLLGALDSKTTNQKMYKNNNGNLIDITDLFWKNSKN